MKIKHVFLGAGLLMLCLYSGCAHVGDQPAKPQKVDVDYQLAPEVQVKDFKLFLDEKCKIAKKPCLTFAITLKNLSDKPQRFITRITLPEHGKSVGGFVPEKDRKDKATGKKKPAALDPGETITEKYPLFHYDLPGKVEVEVTVFK